MNRRTFMRYGIAAGATVAVSAPADLFASLKPQTAPDFGVPHDEFVALTQALERLSHRGLHDLLGSMPSTPSDSDLERSCRSGLSLLMVGASLSAANDASAGRTTPISEMKPPVSDVMLGVVPELGQNLAHQLELLDRLTPQHIAELRARLQADTRPLAQVRGLLEELLQPLGTSPFRHRRLTKQLDRALQRLLTESPEQLVSSLQTHRAKLMTAVTDLPEGSTADMLKKVDALRERPAVQRLARRLQQASEGAAGGSESAGPSDAGQGAIDAVEMDPKKWESQAVPVRRAPSDGQGELFMSGGGIVGVLGLILAVFLLVSVGSLLTGGWALGLFLKIGGMLLVILPVIAMLALVAILLYVTGITIEMKAMR